MHAVRLRSIPLPARGDTVIDQRRVGIDSAVIGFPIHRNLRIPLLYPASTRGQEEKRGNIEGTPKVLDLKVKKRSQRRVWYLYLMHKAL